jgi:hypothetical protein
MFVRGAARKMKSRPLSDNDSRLATAIGVLSVRRAGQNRTHHRCGAMLRGVRHTLRHTTEPDPISMRLVRTEKTPPVKKSYSCHQP